MILVPLPRLVLPTPATLLGRHKGGIDEALGQIDPATGIRFFGQAVENLDEHARLHPGLEVAMASRAKWVSTGHVGSGCTVRKTQKMPFITSRGLRRGQPLPSARTAGEGMKGSINCAIKLLR